MVKKNGMQGIRDVFKFSTDVITVCPKRMFIEHHEEVNLQNKGKSVSYKTLVTTELENIGPTF